MKAFFKFFKMFLKLREKYKREAFYFKPESLDNWIILFDFTIKWYRWELLNGYTHTKIPDLAKEVKRIEAQALGIDLNTLYSSGAYKKFFIRPALK